VPGNQQFTRNVSAEIFVVCREFHAPKAIDPKFLDPKHVFKDLEASVSLDKGATVNNAQANVFQPDKKRRNRAGYADNDYTLFKQIGVSEFIRSSDPIAILGAVNKIDFATEEEKSYVLQPLPFSFLFIHLLVGQLGLTSSHFRGHKGQLRRSQGPREGRLQSFTQVAHRPQRRGLFFLKSSVMFFFIYASASLVGLGSEDKAC
jgi:Domain of unknown function (DUF3381)